MTKALIQWWLLVALLAFFASYIANLAYSAWVLAGFVGVGFTALTYVWAKCSLMSDLGVMFNWLLLIYLVFKVYNYFKEW